MPLLPELSNSGWESEHLFATGKALPLFLPIGLVMLNPRVLALGESEPSPLVTGPRGLQLSVSLL